MKYLLFLWISSFILPVSSQIPYVTNGAIRRFESFQSQYVQPRSIDVWLPPNYNANKKYAVVYMHDGQMLFDSAITWNHQSWKVAETMSQLMKKRQIRDCIVVGIWSNGDYRHAEYFPQKVLQFLPAALRDSVIHDDLKGAPLADRYLLFITRELKPFIDSTFSTYTDKSNTFIAGSSMGGLISLYGICEYPDVFSGAICMSTHWVGSTKHQNMQAFTHAFGSYLKKNLPDTAMHKFYFDYGNKTLDSLYRPYQTYVDKIMAEKGYAQPRWLTKEFTGDDHSEKSWGRRFGTPLRFMLKK